MNLKDLKPIPPWKRILKEHLLDILIGICIGIWICASSTNGFVHVIQEFGGFAALGSFIEIVRRIFMNGKNGKNKKNKGE